MNRRHFLLNAVAGVLLQPLGARAQPGRVYHVGVLSAGGNARTWRHEYKPFIEALSGLNYVEGRNLLIKPAFGDGKAERLPALAAELVNARVDVIVTSGVRDTTAAMRATSTIPIVMWLVVDPVGQGLVASLGRPGGNVTGLTHLVPGLIQKHVELLREVVPAASRFTVVVSPGGHAAPSLQELTAAGRLLGISISVARVAGPADFDDALGRIKKDGAAGIIAISDPVTFLHRKTLVQAALKHRLPGIYWSPEFVEDGGLMTYGTSLADLRRHAAIYVDRLFRGAEPADLPIEQPTKFQLVVNMKTAKELGLTIPSSLLLRAHQVIE